MTMEATWDAMLSSGLFEDTLAILGLRVFAISNDMAAFLASVAVARLSVVRCERTSGFSPLMKACSTCPS